MKLTNNHDIDLPIAVWLMQDGYKSGAADAPAGELISVTTLMKPTRQLILQRKVDRDAEVRDISEYVASRMGHGLHDSLERAWTEGNWRGAMLKLGYAKSYVDAIVINPKIEDIKPGQVPIFLERRGFKVFQKIVITGQMDFVINYAYRDFKSTSTFSYMGDHKTEDFILQGSLYRWIMPEYIKHDKMRIEFLFTDWLRYRAKQDRNYPQSKAAHKSYDLMSLKDTEKWVDNKLQEIRENAGLSQDKMIRCNDRQLWRGDDAYKYYTKQETADANGRCTRNFKENKTDAYLHMEEKGKGVVVKIAGEVKACPWCPAFTICKQRKEYFNDDQSYIV